jgi:hypothetical protein
LLTMSRQNARPNTMAKSNISKSTKNPTGSVPRAFVFTTANHIPGRNLPSIWFCRNGQSGPTRAQWPLVWRATDFGDVHFGRNDEGSHVVCYRASSCCLSNTLMTWASKERWVPELLTNDRSNLFRMQVLLFSTKAACTLFVLNPIV